MKNPKTTDEVQSLKEQLYRVRQQSLAASRQSDFRTVARLTAEAAKLNRSIQCQQDFADCALKSLTVVNALAQIGDEGHFVFPEEPVTVRASILTPTLQEAA
jgi:hypothetical protein